MPRIDSPQVSNLTFQAGAEVTDSNFTGSFSGSFVGDGSNLINVSVASGTVSASAEGSAQGTIALNGVDVNINALGTDDAPQFASIEVGNASDTTITRAAAGQVAVEGNNLLRALVDNVVSGSAEGDAQGQIKLNGVNVNVNDLGTGDSPTFNNVTVSGNLTVSGTTTTIDTNTLDIGDNIIALNGVGSNLGGIAVNDGPASGSLLWDGTNNYWIAGATGSESRVLTELGLGIVSASALSSPAQGEVTLTTNGVAATATDLGLQTSDDVQFNSLGVGTAGSTTTGEIRATNDVTAFYSSDERLKENIEELGGALDKVKALRGVSFDWKELSEEERKTIHSHEGHDIGVIAQEVQAQYPEIVTEREHGHLAVDYGKLTAVLIQAVKELSAKVDELSK